MAEVDELRAAARLLRKRGTEATPGPWHTVGLPWNHETPYVIAGHPDPHFGKFVADVDQVFGDPGEDDRDHGPDAAWIAIMSPALAEPIAAQLDAVADQYDADHQFPARGVACHCWTNDPLCRAALATARALNGTAS